MHSPGASQFPARHDSMVMAVNKEGVEFREITQQAAKAVQRAKEYEDIVVDRFT